MKSEKNICIVGAGLMGISYAKVLSEMKITPCVIGNSKVTSDKFFEATGITPIDGGYKLVLSQLKIIPEYAIVTTPVEVLLDTCFELVKAGVKKILCEKPVALFIEEIIELEKFAKQNCCEIYVAYNRRFYSSVLSAKKLISEEGGISSVHFDFTEWETHVFRASNSSAMKDNWLIANSSHLIDLVFSFIGRPKKISCFKQNKENGLHFGQGISEQGIPFSYHSDWGSAGRWGIEIMTKKNKYIFRPLEKLHVQKKLNMKIDEIVSDDDELDIKYKPGIFKQVDAFLNQRELLLTLDEHIKNFHFYCAINNASPLV